MPYTKPGVEVTYVQSTVSPNLTTPDLQAVIIGDAYQIHDIAPDSDFQDEYPDTYSNTTGATVTLSGIVAAANVDANSVYVDLVYAGGRLHLGSSDFTVATDVVTISGGLDSDYDGASIQIGFREQIMTHNALTTYESLEDIETRIGKVDIYNPLAFGLSLALANAGLTVAGYGTNSATAATAHQNAIDDLALEDDPYIIAPLTHNTAVHSLYQTHATSMSSPTNKRERILVAGRAISWVDASGVAVAGPDAATMNKGETVSDIATAAFSNGERRVFWVYPDVGYSYQTMHLSQIKRSYIQDMFGSAYGHSSGEMAKLPQNITLTDGVKLYKGTQVTDAVWNQLIAGYDGYMIDALMPVPSWYAGSIVAGQRSGLRPEQPLTNVPIAGLTEVKYSSDFFSETQINTAADGGTYWLYQRTLSSPIVSRHQLSTDRSSIQKQEMSITSALDFTGKFIRNGVSFYIGRFTITPHFIKMLQMVVNAQGHFLVREGYLNTFQVISMEVDPTSSDTILCTIEVGVKFPVNRIKFTLKF